MADEIHFRLTPALRSCEVASPGTRRAGIAICRDAAGRDCASPTSAFDDIEEGDSRAAVIDTLGDPDYVEQPPNEGRGSELVRVGELLAWIEDDVQYFVTIIDGEAGAKGSVECSDELAVAC